MNDFFSRIVSGAQKRARYREIVNELGTLSQRDLADIGISSSDIQAVARNAVYG